MKTIAELQAEVRSAADQWDAALTAFETASPDADDYSERQAELDAAVAAHDAAKAALGRREALDAAKAAMPVKVDESAVEARVSVTKESLTYEQHSPHSIFRDMAKAKIDGDTKAAERLARHGVEMQAEKRAISSTDGAGGEFIPPVWLQDQWIALQRAGRPVANTLNSKPLPPNTDTINLPKVSTGAATAVQTDGGAVQSTDIATTSVTGAVQTIAGQQDLSIQLFDLSLPGIDAVIFDDISRDYAQQIDKKVLSGTVTNAKGLDALAGTNAVTYTDASPTVPEIYPKFADAIQQIHTGRFLPPQVIAMHPRRWAWFLASLDSSNRPLIVPNGNAFNQAGVLTNVASENVVGNIQGLPVVVDANIPTTLGGGTEDEILVYRADDIILYESQPKLRVFQEVLSGTLQVRCQIYGYYAIIAGRLPKAISKITGTGLAAPTF